MPGGGRKRGRHLLQRKKRERLIKRGSGMGDCWGMGVSRIGEKKQFRRKGRGGSHGTKGCLQPRRVLTLAPVILYGTVPGAGKKERILWGGG